MAWSVSASSSMLSLSASSVVERRWGPPDWPALSGPTCLGSFPSSSGAASFPLGRPSVSRFLRIEILLERFLDADFTEGDDLKRRRGARVTQTSFMLLAVLPADRTS